MVRIERVADVHAETGENPLWHPDEKRLYWLDIPPGKLYSYDPKTDSNELAYEMPDKSAIGGFTVEADGALLLFGAGGRITKWEPATSRTTVVVDGIDREANGRFNDVIATPEGRVFCGSMPTENHLGSLYRLDRDRSVTTVLSDIDIANGMGFTADEKTFYFTESNARRIYAFDYSRESGELSSRRTFVQKPADNGIPDGMVVDADGCVWSARWNGGVVVRYDQNGRSISKIEFPARKVSSVAFGGPDFEDLYVTTALGEGGYRPKEGDGAGALFRVSELHVGGVPEYYSRVATK
ncbi:SMP-30/gluconolactonase/LRE family protein [Haladaptatus salinisoli]|uniref:SMP-30/gluconolactonase/LRE family protein n=1 Tax=Haladaptatus salinisoli TaxID=2884876 RepID=UPI001D09A28D|nr:SMP-30/gluconolactonase/LRE family protein [Haladaptatus salinisoli]